MNLHNARRYRGIVCSSSLALLLLAGIAPMASAQICDRYADRGDTPAVSIYVNLVSCTRGDIDSRDDVDWFHFVVPPDGHMPNERLSVSTDTDNVTVTLYRLKPGASVQSVSSDQYGGGSQYLDLVNDHHDFSLSEGENKTAWFVKVEGKRTGVYMLRVRISHDPPEPSKQTLPMVKASGASIEGIVRFVNNSDESGTVRIYGIDDAGRRFGPVTLALDANVAAHIRSSDLEAGNNGLSGGLGDGEGDWRLILESDLNIGALAYIRTADGFVTNNHDTLSVEGTRAATSTRVLFFNPAINPNQRSRLRLINPGTEAAEVTINARDDKGKCAPGGVVRLSIPAGASRMLGAVDLESGDAEIDGSFGEGKGKWRLFIKSSVPIEVVNLLESASGHLANLSTAPFDMAVDYDDYGDTADTASFVEVPSTIGGNLGVGSCDRDYFRFYPERAGKLQVRIIGDIETVGTLFRGSDPVAMGRGREFSLMDEAQAGARYNVEVKGYNSSMPGDYTLVVAMPEPPEEPSAVPGTQFRD